MYLSNISNDILEFTFKFLSKRDKLNLIKANKKLIYNFKIDGIKIQLDLRYLAITGNDLSYLTGIHTINLAGCLQINDEDLRYLTLNIL